MVLYDDQEVFLQKTLKPLLPKYRKICAQAPTGSGKTVMFSKITVDAYKKGLNIAIFTNRKKLFWQTYKTLKQNGLSIKPIYDKATNREANGRVNLIMSQTFKNTDLDLSHCDLVMADECHLSEMDAWINMAPKYAIGWTATPYRLDKKKPMNKVYEHLATYTLSTQELINKGRLKKPIYYVQRAFDESKLRLGSKGEYVNDTVRDATMNQSSIKSMIDTYKSKSHVKRILHFCSNIEDAHKIAEAFTKEGIPSLAVDGTQDEDVVNEAINKLRDGDIRVLVSVMMLTYGFDLPNVDGVGIGVYTTSLAKWMQMIGRGGRYCPGMEAFYIFDFTFSVDNVHPAWEADIDWHTHFAPPEKVEKEAGPGSSKECPKCGKLNSINAVVCCNVECVYVFPRKEKGITAGVHEALKLYFPETVGFSQKEIDFSKFSVKEIDLYGKLLNYGPLWAAIKLYHIHKDSLKLVELARLRGSQNPVVQVKHWLKNVPDFHAKK